MVAKQKTPKRVKFTTKEVARLKAIAGIPRDERNELTVAQAFYRVDYPDAELPTALSTDENDTGLMKESSVKSAISVLKGIAERAKAANAAKILASLKFASGTRGRAKAEIMDTADAEAALADVLGDDDDNGDE